MWPACLPARLLLQVVDAPRFMWRGVLLDVGRHFFPVPFILKLLDLLALYKMNRFHWHLTEDQVGCRLSSGWQGFVRRWSDLSLHPTSQLVAAARLVPAELNTRPPTVAASKKWCGHGMQRCVCVVFCLLLPTCTCVCRVGGWMCPPCPA